MVENTAIDQDRRITVSTGFNDPLIEQTIDLRGDIHRTVMNTADQQIRQALIELGWTPPAT
jgi:hypothetical protein